jgi:hypothetical protein
MFAYVDETGNTGKNLFDDSQHQFITAALMTRANFDVLYKKNMKELAGRLGVKVLHANELGLSKLETIACDLQKIFKISKSRFFMSRLEKNYLATTKIVDMLFDSGETLAVPWHIYNYRPLRLLLVIKVAGLLDETLAQSFWSALLEPKLPKATIKFIEACKELLLRVPALPDRRSIDLISEALQWAIENPEAIYFHTASKIARKGHLPNLVAFVNLLDGIEEKSKAWNVPVNQIYHDRQMEFQQTLQHWHEIFSNAKPDPLFLPGGEKHIFRRVFGSEFVISSAQESVGIQAIDIILWLFKRLIEGKNLGENSSKLLIHVFRHAKQHDFSFMTISKYVSDTFDFLFNEPISDEQMKKAQELLEYAEERRQEKLFQYAENKLIGAVN